MNILFIRPHNASLTEIFGRAEGGAIPLGIAYIAAYLKANGINSVAILDNHVENLNDNQFKEHLRRYNPDLVGIYTTTPTMSIALDIAKTVKSLRSDTLVVMGGPHVSALPEEALKNKNVDIVVVGEGELTMLDLVRTLEGGMSLRLVKGIYCKENGKIVSTGTRELIQDIDSIPFPARDLLPMDKYYMPITRKKVSGKADVVLISRGCPFQCAFCSKPVFGRSIRSRSAQSVIEEIEFLVDKYGVREIAFQDDAKVNLKLAKEICEIIIERRINVVWTCHSRVDNLSEDLVRLYKRAGCKQINFGVETGSQEIMKTISKGITLQQVHEAIGLCKKYKIATLCGFVLGLPGENRKTAQQTIDFAKKLNPDYAAFYQLVVFPGSRLFHTAQEKGLINPEDYDKYVTMSNRKMSVLMSDLTADELIEFQKKAFREFYLRPKFIWNRIKNVRSLLELKQGILGIKTLLKHQVHKYAE